MILRSFEKNQWHPPTLEKGIPLNLAILSMTYKKPRLFHLDLAYLVRLAAECFMPQYTTYNHLYDIPVGQYSPSFFKGAQQVPTKIIFREPNQTMTSPAVLNLGNPQAKKDQKNDKVHPLARSQKFLEKDRGQSRGQTFFATSVSFSCVQCLVQSFFQSSKYQMWSISVWRWVII